MLTHLKRLYRFWANKELIYVHKSTLTGTGNRSTADNVYDTIF